MSLEKIGHYSLENPATIYDEEAMTALKLAARTAAKTNEAVEAFNKLETETGDHLQEQDKTIEDRMKVQDDRITKMNDETMPEKVTSEVGKQIQNGTFDHQINNYIGNLEERVDNLLGSVTEGSTTLDTEIIDLRTAENGMVFEFAGDCIREEFSKLNSVLRFKPSWFDNYYIGASSGNLLEYEGNYSASDFIEIPSNLKTIGVKTVTHEADASGLCFYDVNKLFIDGVNVGAGTNNWSEKIVSIPEGARYIRYTCRTPYINSSFLFVTDNLTTLLNDGEKEEKALELTITEGQFVTKSGIITVIDKPNFITSELDVKPYQTFTLTSSSVDASRQYVILSSTGSVLDYFPKENQNPATTQTVTFTIPEKGSKLLLGSYKSGITIFEVINTSLLNERIDALQNEVNSITSESANFYKYAFEKILCIGDSLTEGACYVNGHTGDSIPLNFPHYLGKMLNCVTTNAGKSGASASDWHKNFFNLYNFADYDGFVIWLGTNYGCDSMPTDEEIENFTPDYTERAETANQSLYLIDIIESIKEQNPDAVIFLCNIYASKSDVEANNSVLEKIAEKYNLPLVDMTDLGKYNHPELHDGVSNVHFGKAGNIFIANRLANSFAEYFNDDPLRVEFGY